MKDTFNIWTVENPMTVIRTPIFRQPCGGWNWTDCYIYTAWDYKTMNLNTIKIKMPLN